MTNDILLSIAEFASYASVSKQAIYKQVNNENSKLSPYIVKDKNKVFIKASALKELYEVDIYISTNYKPLKVENTTFQQPKSTENSQPLTQPLNPINQPVSTDYIEFLKAQIEELKTEKKELEQRLNSIIHEKDEIIKEQSDQLAQFAQQSAELATNAIKITSQQQYLTATASIQEQKNTDYKKGFWRRLFK